MKTKPVKTKFVIHTKIKDFEAGFSQGFKAGIVFEILKELKDRYERPNSQH